MYYSLINSMNRAVLASYLTPTFAYSFRKVVSTATLSCRVRRTLDNAEMDIGFVGNDLDTATLLAFVNPSGSDAYITTIYEQNGSGINLTQTAGSYQFKIVNSGIVYTLNGKPSCITTSITGAPRYLQTNALFSPSVITGASVFSVTKLITQLGGTYNVDFKYSIGNGVASQSGRLLDITSLGASGTPTTYSQGVEQSLSVIQTPYTSGTKIQSHLIKSGANKFYINNDLVGSDSINLVTPAINQKLNINAASWDQNNYDLKANQYFSEILIYNSDQLANLTTIHNNINSYYSIY